MNFLTPLLSAAQPIPLHALAALAALLIGTVQLLRRKGGPSHRVLGYIWVGLLTIVAVSGFFISEIRLIGRFSPVHILSGLTLIFLLVSLRYARQGRIAEHRKVMLWLFFAALVLTGAFTFLPGRIMYQIVTGTG